MYGVMTLAYSHPLGGRGGLCDIVSMCVILESYGGVKCVLAAVSPNKRE
jgi:hypothetical protein